MLLPLVIAELVNTIECPMSLTVTAVDKTGMLKGAMFLDMAAEITGAGEGCGTACARKAVGIGIGVGASDSCGDASDGSRQISTGCHIRLGVGACGTVYFKSSSWS